jgi:hypothetical protein
MGASTSPRNQKTSRFLPHSPEIPFWEVDAATDWLPIE